MLPKTKNNPQTSFFLKLEDQLHQQNLIYKLANKIDWTTFEVEFSKRAGIEPRIGHLKSDHRLGRNFLRGIVGDSINVLLAAAAFNFKRAMRVL